MRCPVRNVFAGSCVYVFWWKSLKKWSVHWKSVQLTWGFSYECGLSYECGFSYECPPLLEPPLEECIAMLEDAVPALLAASEADACPIPDSSVWKGANGWFSVGVCTFGHSVVNDTMVGLMDGMSCSLVRSSWERFMWIGTYVFKTGNKTETGTFGSREIGSIDIFHGGITWWIDWRWQYQQW